MRKEVITISRLAICKIVYCLVFLIAILINNNYLITCFAVLDIFISAIIIILVYKRNECLINPLSIVLFVWGVLVPLTSFQTIMMDALSHNEWIYCIIAEMAIIVGIIASNYSRVSKQKFVDAFELRKSKFRVLLFFLLISILAICIGFYIRGGITLFSANVRQNMDKEIFMGYNILANLGTICVFCIFQDRKYIKNKLVIFLTAVYFVLLILTAVRFSIIIMVVLLMSTITFNKKNMKKIIAGTTAIIAIFLYVNAYRKGIGDIQKYYVNTNLFSGDVKQFYYTEIIRYFGMSQRLMGQWIDNFSPGVNVCKFTLYPLFKTFFIELSCVENIYFYGYNATNVVSYLYVDFGYLWPLILIIWSYVWGKSFVNFRLRSNLMNRYWWSIGLVSYALSFYCYIYHYVYWLTYYPLFIYIICKFTLRKRRV